MRYLFGGLSLATFVSFFIFVFFATDSAHYPGNVISGILAIVCLLASYFLNRASRRLRRT